jgi:hypothetical protein
MENRSSLSEFLSAEGGELFPKIGISRFYGIPPAAGLCVSAVKTFLKRLKCYEYWRIGILP